MMAHAEPSTLAGPYTEGGNAEVEARIGAIVDQIRVASGRVPGVTAVLLGGSLARGEATWASTSGVLLSDVEVFLVGESSKLRKDAKRLSGTLSDQSGAEVSVAWLQTRRLELGRAKNLSLRASRTIQHFELATGSRLLAGTPPAFAVVEAAALPLAEGIRLILNRCAEGAPFVATGRDNAARWVDKLLIAAGDTMLLARGAYALHYRERARRLGGFVAPWPMPRDWLPVTIAAYDRKLGRNGTTVSPAEAAEIAVGALSGAIARELAITNVDWADFPAVFASRAARQPSFLRYLLPVGPSRVYEGMILAARAMHAGRRLGLGVVREALSGRPLSLWMQGAAAPMLLAIVRNDSRLAAAVRSAVIRAGVSTARGRSLPVECRSGNLA